MNKPSTLNLENMSENEKFLYTVELTTFMRWKAASIMLKLSLLGNVLLMLGWWLGQQA